ETTERRLHCAVLVPVSAAEAAWGTRPLEWRSHLNFLLLDVREKGTALAPSGSACGQAGPCCTGNTVACSPGAAHSMHRVRMVPQGLELRSISHDRRNRTSGAPGRRIIHVSVVGTLHILPPVGSPGWCVPVR